MLPSASTTRPELKNGVGAQVNRLRKYRLTFLPGFNELISDGLEADAETGELF